MCKKPINKLLKFYFIIIISLFLRTGNNIFASSILSDISSTFSKYYNNVDDSYLNAPYSSNYSKDPFADNFDNIQNMVMFTKVAGVKYVEEALAREGCTQPNKEIRGILYYYSDDFRGEIAMQLKGSGKHAKNIIINEKDIIEYCTSYYRCTHTNRNDSITSTASENILTNCKEFFLSNYNKGLNEAKRFQQIETSELGADKYWNATTDDSPYDIMTDLETIGMLLYKESEKVVTPVLYHLPVFSNSENAMNEVIQSNNESTTNTTSTNNGNAENQTTATTINLGGDSGNNGGALGNNGGSPTQNPTTQQPANPSTFIDEDIIDFMESGLSKTKQTSTLGCPCNTLTPKNEPEAPKQAATTTIGGFPSDISTFTNEEYEAFVNDMINSVNPYTQMNKETTDKIEKKASEGNARGTTPTSSDQIEEVAETIKDCRQSCEGLHIDQKASCMLMCACGETTSKQFDPEEFPGLGPIFKIRYCTIPATNSKFSVGGTKIISIEEGINEIYGVVDKLSREGKLGTRTQQYNFLDSSTKNMNFADTFAFNINVELVDIGDNHHESEQFKKIQKDIELRMNRVAFKTRTALDDVTKNIFRVSNGNYGSDDFKGEYTDLSQESSTTVDLAEISNAQRRIGFSSLLNSRIDQQHDLRESADGYMKTLLSHATNLYGKKDS